MKLKRESNVSKVQSGKNTLEINEQTAERGFQMLFVIITTHLKCRWDENKQ